MSQRWAPLAAGSARRRLWAGRTSRPPRRSSRRCRPGRTVAPGRIGWRGGEMARRVRGGRISGRVRWSCRAGCPVYGKESCAIRWWRPRRLRSRQAEAVVTRWSARRGSPRRRRGTSGDCGAARRPGNSSARRTGRPRGEAGRPGRLGPVDQRRQLPPQLPLQRGHLVAGAADRQPRGQHPQDQFGEVPGHLAERGPAHRLGPDRSGPPTSPPPANTPNGKDTSTSPAPTSRPSTAPSTLLASSSPTNAPDATASPPNASQNSLNSACAGPEQRHMITAVS